MKFIRKKTIDLTKDDDDLLQFICRKEETDQTNAIRIALKNYKENFESTKALKKLVEQQQETNELLKKVLENQTK